MWVPLVTTLLIVSANALNLTGDHVCEQEERYSVNVTHNFLKNATVRVYVWCLHIPPRCSSFQTRTYNVAKTVEEARIRKVPVCCEGYEPDNAGEKCVPHCDHCINGICNDEHKCYCHPGYRGDHCERGCEFARWGRYCRYHCSCERGECDPKNGHCECPSGWTGTRCEQQCQDGHFGVQCKSLCNCSDDEICSPADGRCLSKDKYLEDASQSKLLPTSKKYNPFGISTIVTKKVQAKLAPTNEKQPTKTIVGVYVLTTSEPDIETTTEVVELTTSYENIPTITEVDEIDNATTKPISQSEEIITSSSTTEVTTKHEEFNEIPAKSEEVTTIPENPIHRILQFPDKSTEDNTIPENPNSIMVTEKNDNFVDVMKRNALNEGNTPDGDFVRDKDVHHQSFRRNAIIGIISTVLTICILFVGVGLYTTARIKEKHRKQEELTEAARVAFDNEHSPFNSKSIFHFPLPDPPDSYEDNTIKRLDSNTTFKSPPTKSSEDTYKTSIDYLELFYDQPPSRGTYRAASVPEPPNVNAYKTPHAIVEPIYDEIPSWADSGGPLYVNSTLEEITKF